MSIKALKLPKEIGQALVSLIEKGKLETESAEAECDCPTCKENRGEVQRDYSRFYKQEIPLCALSPNSNEIIERIVKYGHALAVINTLEMEHYTKLFVERYSKK